MTALLLPTSQVLARFDADHPPLPPVPPTEAEADRPPVCPVCHRRLVILAARFERDAAGASVRRHLWGCPRGHATATYEDGAFGPIEVLPDVE